jgi:hypothetical protein
MFLSRYHLIPIHIIKIITMDYTPVVEYGVGTGYRNAQLFLILKYDHRNISKPHRSMDLTYFWKNLCILMTTIYTSLMYGEAAI